mmetsp:Transcript_70320/g.132708  ORF Transcript_70320/g.132708 Transcript_70320/m.132708 type:complete len:430 (-) Transcript_70320:39-1328(-)
MNHTDRVDISRSMVSLTFYNGDYIYQQDDVGSAVYVLLSGEVICRANGEEVARYNGSLPDVSERSIAMFLVKGVVYFGEDGFKNDKRSSSILVCSPKAVLLAITRDVVEMVTKCVRPAEGVPDVELQKFRAKDYSQAAHHHVFSWLTWSPKPDSCCYRALHDHFPCAIPGPALFCRSIFALEKFGFSPANTIYGTSIDPDKINSRTPGFLQQMRFHWGEDVALGGIFGAPFVGKSGFDDFSNKVPENGNVIMLFGSHIGISEEGLIGKVRRQGEEGLSNACSAAIGAYNACIKSGSDSSDVADFDKMDLRMDWIKQQLAPYAQKISRQEHPMVALAQRAYKIIEDEVNKIVSNDFGDGYLALLGIIQINMPEPYFDHFFPVKFEVRNKKESHDMMPRLAVPEFLQEGNFSRRMIEESLYPLYLHSAAGA